MVYVTVCSCQIYKRNIYICQSTSCHIYHIYMSINNPVFSYNANLLFYLEF